MAWLFSKGLAAGTVKNYLAAVRHAQISQGLGDPRMGSMPQLEYVLKGLKRKSEAQARTRLPVTLEVLQGLRGCWQTLPNQRNAAMLWAAATLCFFGFLRTGEVVVPADGAFDPLKHLAYGDVRIDNYRDPQSLEVRIKASNGPISQGCQHLCG